MITLCDYLLVARGTGGSFCNGQRQESTQTADD